MCDYYDIEEILYEDERVPCVFNTDAINLGYLDPGRMDDDLEEGCKVCSYRHALCSPVRVLSQCLPVSFCNPVVGVQVDLPLWMAGTLAARNMVAVQQPPCFSSKVRNQLSADPGSVKLRDKNPYYYELGMELSALANDGSLPSTLRKVLATRFSSIFDRSTNSRNEDTTLMMRDLTNMERTLFEAGYESASTLYRWKTRQLTRLATADIFKRGMKRARLDR